MSTQETGEASSDNGLVSLDQNHLTMEVDAQELLSALSALDRIVGECRLHFTDDAIRAHVVDPANVMIAEVAITDFYWKTDENPITVGVNTANLLKQAKSVHEEDTIQIRLDDGDDEMKLYSGVFMNYVELTDPAAMRKDAEPPEIDFDTNVEVEAMKFKGAVGAVSGASYGAVRLTADDGQLLVEGRDHGKDGYPHSWPIEADIDGGSPQVPFSDNYFQDITSSIRPEGSVQLEMKDEMPIRVNPEGCLEFLLAPKIVKESNQ